MISSGQPVFFDDCRFQLYWPPRFQPAEAFGWLPIFASRSLGLGCTLRHWPRRTLGWLADADTPQLPLFIADGYWLTPISSQQAAGIDTGR